MALSIPGFNLENFFTELDKELGIFFQSIGVMSRTKDDTLSVILHSRLSKSLTRSFFGDYTSSFYGDFYTPGKYEKLRLKILDKLSYDFAIEVLALLEIAPKELKDSVPFFDPSVLPKGIIPSLVKEFFGVSLEHLCENNQFNYIFKLTGIKPEPLTINVADAYNTQLDYVIKSLASSVANYFFDNAHGPHVKSELAKGEPHSAFVINNLEPKAKLITEFIEKENKEVEILIADLEKDTNIDYKISDESSYEENVIYLNSIVDLLATSKDKFVGLQNRNTNYNKTSIKLLMTDKNLKKQITNASVAGLNLELPLPKVVIRKSSENNYESIVLADALKFPEKLIQLHLKLDAKIEDIKQRRKFEIEKWKNQELAIHSKNNLGYLNDLDAVFKEASFEIKVIEGTTDEQIEALKNQLNSLGF